MQWTNTTRAYGWLTITLHWIVVIAVVLMLLIGWRADALGEAGDREGRGAVMFWHISIGGTFALVLLARVLAHYLQRQPEKPRQAKALNVIASLNHNLLLLAILILIISGPMTVWSAGRAINLWNVISLPTPFAAENEGAHEFFESMHALGRYMLYVLIPLHVLGALKHLFIDRDGVFRRMFMPAPLKQQPPAGI